MNIDIEDKDFSNDFRQFYRKELAIYMDDLEKERKKFLNIIYSIIFVSCIILGFLIKYLIQIDIRLSGYFIAGVVLLILWIAKKYKTKVKKKVLSKLLSYIGDFRLIKNDYTLDNIKSLNLFPIFNSVSFDDRIKGLYKLLNVDIVELSLTRSYGKSSAVVFQGLLIKVPCNKKFTGITVIRDKSSNPDSNNSFLGKEISLFNKNLEKPKLDKVVLEDTEFNKFYDVNSTDQIEARYLITTAFMNRMLNMAKGKAESKISVSFEHGHVYISVYTPFKDWFEVPILKPTNDINNYKAIIYEIIQIMKIIDSLKLEQKIGL